MPVMLEKAPRMAVFTMGAVRGPSRCLAAIALASTVATRNLVGSWNAEGGCVLLISITPDEKDVEFDKAPFGINGIETAVSLLLDRLVNKNIISLKKFIKMISTAPSLILWLENKGKICVGADADLTILNLSEEIVVDVNTFKSKSRNNPFQGWKLKGTPAMTIVGGKIVYPFSSSKSL